MESGDNLDKIERHPCRYCTADDGRSSDCHATCERYLASRKLKQKEHDEVQRQKTNEADFYRYQRDILPRYNRKNFRG